MSYSHRFVEQYDGILAFGLSREIDEATLVCYLQKFSDDALVRPLVGRLSDAELEEVHELLMRLMKRHLSEAEYHRYFLKD